MHAFGIMREFMQDRKYTGILNMEIPLRNSVSLGFTKQFILGRIFIKVVGKFLHHFSQQTALRGTILGITKSSVF